MRILGGKKIPVCIRASASRSVSSVCSGDLISKVGLSLNAEFQPRMNTNFQGLGPQAGWPGIFRPRFVFIRVHSWFRTKSFGLFRSSGLFFPEQPASAPWANRDILTREAGFPRRCPTRLVMLAGMKNRILQSRDHKEVELIATFGEARLMKVDGKIQLRGGSMSDRMEALEWLSLFLPEEVACVER